MGVNDLPADLFNFPSGQKVFVPSKSIITPLAMDVAVTSGVTVYTTPVAIDKLDNLTLFLKAAGTTPHIQILREYNFSQAIDQLDLPLAANWATTNVSGAVDELSSDFSIKTWSINQEITPIGLYAVWQRYKLVGLGTTSVDTTISIIAVGHAMGDIS
jgi:hypothetical protein